MIKPLSAKCERFWGSCKIFLEIHFTYNWMKSWCFQKYADGLGKTHRQNFPDFQKSSLICVRRKKLIEDIFDRLIFPYPMCTHGRKYRKGNVSEHSKRICWVVNWQSLNSSSTFRRYEWVSFVCTFRSKSNFQMLGLLFVVA